ncbi:RES domain-containing protein [Enterobacter sp. Bisph1]|uniref:RES family NAD+ phosphorylase n=1 Tax=Enterobacter sp. Bisph1 TaxID=1274399 RepID=UPI00057C2AC0|nr:RES domain-containing protein [Enterobacter sp. Bisph1]
MIFYRLVTHRYASEAWTGSGANLYGGRWNHKGHPAVYVASSVSLAALEMLVHVHSDRILNQYRLFSIEVADKDVEYLDKQWLPPDWQENPAPLSTMDLGTAWLEANSAVALLLPSCIIPLENNAILNPQHADFNTLLKTVKEHPFSFDARLAIS